MNKVVLVSCVGKKLAEPARAADLYQSTWFKKARAYAEAMGDRWYILSAKHGLIRPGQLISPYDLTLNSMSKSERWEWAWQTWAWSTPELNPLKDELIMLAGRRYRGFLVPWWEARGFVVRVSMRGMKIGQQLRWLAENGG